MKYIIEPKSIFLLENFASIVFFEKVKINYQNFILSLEKLLELYLNEVPYNFRDLPLSEQADIQWRGIVLPNLRSTMDILNKAYIKINDGDLTYLTCVRDLRSNSKGIIEFSMNWMDDLPKDKVIQCWEYYDRASQYASLIANSYPTSWENEDLMSFPNIEPFNGIDLQLPASYPVYRVNPAVSVKTDGKVTQTGVYINEIDGKQLAFMASSSDEDRGFGQSIAISMDPETYEIVYGKCKWLFIERIADQGGSATVVSAEYFKRASGQSCPRSGFWWSPANQSKSKYFELGEVFPNIDNNAWGETIWYSEIGNKNNLI